MTHQDVRKQIVRHHHSCLTAAQHHLRHLNKGEVRLVATACTGFSVSCPKCPFRKEMAVEPRILH